MKAAILGLLAETSIHPGAGSSVGVIDLPVAREAATDYPVIVGSSLKGALRDAASDASETEPSGVPRKLVRFLSPTPAFYCCPYVARPGPTSG